MITAPNPRRFRENRSTQRIDADIAPRSGDLFRFCRDKTVAVLQDGENISISTEKLGYQVDQHRLGVQMKEHCKSCDLHVFASGDDPRHVVGGPYPAPWQMHFNQAETVQKHDGPVRRSNADNLMLFTAGTVLASRKPDILILATGDGDLAVDLARFAKKLWGDSLPVATLSVAGATSWRLDARRNDLFVRNFEIGYDLFV